MPPLRAEYTEDTHSPLTIKVANDLRARILKGELGAGTRLVESRLSGLLGVSRVPVREALRLLAMQGLVEVTPRRGATVTALNEEQVREMLEVRATLEALNAQLAAQRRDPVELDALQQLLDEASQLGISDDIGHYVAMNARCHAVLGQLARNSLLQDMMRPLRERTAMLFDIKDHGHIRRACQEHIGIIAAVLAGDGELAALLARRHVTNAAGCADTVQSSSNFTRKQQVGQ